MNAVRHLPRLGPDTVLPDGVVPPPVVPTGVGIVHLGWGAFHRAHQAVYTQEAMAASGDLSWGILGDVERSPELVPALREQHGRYTVLAVGPDESGVQVEEARVVASVVDVAYPGDETGRLLAAIAAPTTHVITLTITEKGYCRGADGHLDLGLVDADVESVRSTLGCACDASATQDPVTWCESCRTNEGSPAQTAVGLLVWGLAVRWLAGGAPITVLSCDNMAHNGVVLRQVAEEFVAAVASGAGAGRPADQVAAFTTWLERSTTWPSSMVDRITPRVTPQTRDQIAHIVGARDEAGVSAEPFSQWVIEDSFAGPRPAWELAGAQVAPREVVAQWEEAKLRMLNGTHSVIAYAGRLFGHPTMAEAVAAPQVADHARTYMFEDALPSVTAPAGADLVAYGEGLLTRFANPATGHATAQVSTDGSQKIPIRWGQVAAHHLAEGRVPQGVAFGLAAWAEFVRRAVRDGVDLGDPAGAARLTATAIGTGLDDPAAVATALIALPGLLPDGVGTHPGLVDAVRAHATALAAVGTPLCC